MTRFTPLYLFFCLLLGSCGSLPTSSEVAPKRKGLFQLSSPELATEREQDREESSVIRPDEETCDSDPERIDRILAEADPDNFPKIRYRKGARWEQHKSTDCSWFVFDVFQRAGLPFGYKNSSGLKQAPEFDRVPWAQRQAGDLILFRGHVGILDRDGKVISATRTRRRHQRAITRNPPEFFPKLAGERPVLRYRCNAPEEGGARSTATMRVKTSIMEKSPNP